MHFSLLIRCSIRSKLYLFLFTAFTTYFGLSNKILRIQYIGDIYTMCYNLLNYILNCLQSQGLTLQYLLVFSPSFNTCCSSTKTCEFFVCPHVKQYSEAMRYFIHDNIHVFLLFVFHYPIK